ncbi:MAG: YqaA family protein [Phycisphaeraceae bacterium]
MTDDPGQPPPPERLAVPRWAIHRRLYDWVLSFAQTRHATPALAAISFAESSFFPIPPDVLLGPLCLGHRRKAWWFAAVTTVASVAGAILGYLIGWGLWEVSKGFLYDWIPGFTPENFATVEAWYAQWGVWVLFGAAFTPLPFKVFTIAGGVLDQPFALFVLVSIVGRGMRFFLVAAIFNWLGARAMPFIDRWFNWLSLLFVVLLVGGFLALKLLH